MTPLGSMGRYAPFTVSAVVFLVIIAAILSRLLGHPDTFLDTLAFGAFTAVMGAAGSVTLLNGTVKRTAAQDEELVQLRADVARLKGDG